jgi:dolichol-phosphate mannosyltransferase
MRIAAIVPCYKVKAKVEAVLRGIHPAVAIVCVDDACPEQSGQWIEQLKLPNVTVIYNEKNLGVGGAVKAGFAYALEHTNADAFVKVDGDGQMPLHQMADLIKPLAEGRADYVKGNRFYYLRYLKGMPMLRLMGNGMLSFFTKLSSGYWDLMDPTNGFVAISRAKLEELELDEIDNRYFFESDMLCKLYLTNAVVRELPMRAKYEDEKSNLKPLQEIWRFSCKHARNTFKRIVYTYFVRDFNAGSLALLLAFVLGTIGVVYGSINWMATLESGQARASGTVMLSALSVILSIQFLIFFLTVDMQNNPNLKPR